MKLGIIAVVLVTIGCKGRDDKAAVPVGESQQPAIAEPGEPAETQAAGPREVRVELERPPTGSGAPLPVTFTLPAGWAPSKYDHWFMAVAERDLSGPSNLVLSSGCQGSCSAEDIPTNIENVIASIKKNANRPNLNTGDPKRDAVRGTFTLLQERELAAGGKVLAYRVTYSDEVLASGPYQQRVSMRCFLHRAGDRFYVELSGGADIKVEQTRLPEMIAACESARIAEPGASTETPADDALAK